jgi:mannosyltransferase OCH1-like enzyme
MIPKIIHQTWKTNVVPEEWEHAVESCKTMNSEYKYILWTHKTMEDFVKKEYPGFLNVYKSYKHNIQRCDAFRYLVLYKYGGIYLDMDIVCKKKLNSLLKYDFVLTKSSNINSFTNMFFMVIPKHPFMKFCIDNLPNYIDSYSYFGNHLHIMNSTGPLYLTNMLNKYGIQNINNMYILTNDEFAGDCNICTENSCRGGVYFKHITGNSWHSFDSTFYNICFCNYKAIISVILILIAMFILLLYNKVIHLQKILWFNVKNMKINKTIMCVYFLIVLSILFYFWLK